MEWLWGNSMPFLCYWKGLNSNIKCRLSLLCMSWRPHTVDVIIFPKAFSLEINDRSEDSWKLGSCRRTSIRLDCDPSLRLPAFCSLGHGNTEKEHIRFLWFGLIVSLKHHFLKYVLQSSSSKGDKSCAKKRGVSLEKPASVFFHFNWRSFVKFSQRGFSCCCFCLFFSLSC